jgi:tetratricopeptide (TPR) repeat protein
MLVIAALLAGAAVAGALVWGRGGEAKAGRFVDPVPLTWEVPNPETSRMEPQVAALLRDARAAVMKNPEAAGAWGRLGQVYDAHGMNARAEYCYRHAAHLAPTDARWAYHRALMRDFLHGEPEEVIALFHRALVLSNDSPLVAFRLGDAMSRRGRHVDAAEAFRRVITQAPDFGQAHRSLGQSYVALGDLAQASRHLHRAADLLPQDSMTWAILAQVHMRLDRPDLAEQAARRAEQGHPVSDIVDPLRHEVSGLGVGHVALVERNARRIRERRFTEAREELVWAVQHGLDSAQVHGQLALCYEVLGDRNRAVHHLRRASELEPDDEVLKSELARMTSSPQ